MTTPLDIALAYVAEGWAVVPIAHKQKRPSLLEWQTLRIGADDATQYFNGAEQNIGVILGDASHGLTDIDLDCDEAVRAAPYILPKTRCFGRESKRASHWLYYTDLAHSAEKATLQWKEGPKPLLECRVGATGAQTVFPGSTHPSGEAIAWEDNNPIAKVDGAELVRLCARLGAVSLLARHFPAQGGRHDAGLAIGGFLAKCGFRDGKVFAEAVCVASSQPPDKKRDIVRAVCDTIADAKAGRAGLYGLTKLKEVFGDEAAKKCADWLGYKSDTNHQSDDVWAPDPPPPDPREDAPQEPPLPPLRATNPAALAGRPVPVRQWLVPDWVPYGVVTGLYGDGGLGKSLLAQQLQTGTALGRLWLGLPVEQVASLGVYCEDEEDELHRRQAAINESYGCDVGALADVHWLPRLGEDNIMMSFGRNGAGQLTPFQKSIIEMARDLEVRLVVIDTATDVFAGNENDRGQVRQFISRALGSIAQAINGAVLLCAHPSRTGLSSGEGDGGSTAWSNSLRSRLFLRAPALETGDDRDPDARILDRKKANYAARNDEIKLRWRNGVIEPEARASLSPTPFGILDAKDVFLALLDDFTATRRKLSNNSHSGNFAPREFGKLPRDKRGGYRIADFQRAMDSLFDSRKIELAEYGRKSDPRQMIVRTIA